MGEKIKTLAEGVLCGHELEVELNGPLSKGGEEQVHFQSSKFRLEMDKTEFVKFAASVIYCSKQLRTKNSSSEKRER